MFIVNILNALSLVNNLQHSFDKLLCLNPGKYSFCTNEVISFVSLCCVCVCVGGVIFFCFILLLCECMHGCVCALVYFQQAHFTNIWRKLYKDVDQSRAPKLYPQPRLIEQAGSRYFAIINFDELYVVFNLISTLDRSYTFPSGLVESSL